MKLGPDVKDGGPLAEIVSRETIHKQWSLFERVRFRSRLFNGEWSPETERDVIKPGPGGQVVAILPYDPVRDVLVMNEEFRIGAQEAGLFPYLLEVCAGYMEKGESTQDAAFRELKEETALTPKRLEPVYTILPTAGMSTETINAFIGEVDSAAGQQHGGMANETEFIRTHVLPVSEVIAMMDANKVPNGIALVLLNWFARHHQALRQRWLERGVSLGDAGERPLQWADHPAHEGMRPPTEHPDAAYAPGTVTETHAQAEAFVTTLAQRMGRGAAFFIDYGFPEREYYLNDRRGGTLMCHHAHTADPDPLSMVGDKDITAHVNFTGIALAGQEAGWEVLGYTSQGRFLSNCGLGEALARCAQPSSLEEVKARAALQMLVAEHEMGELFKVIGFVKGPWFDAIGFQHGDRTHTL
mgnify:CR=1 FL=1